MSKKPLPYFFLAFLLAILLFIVGVRYGQQVEKVNKTITYLISLPPSPTGSPTIPPLGFSTYTHTGCQVSFLIPNLIEKTKESSASAVFSSKDKKLAIALSCEKKELIKEDKELSVNLNKTIRAYEVQTKDTTSYRIVHPLTRKVVTITVAKSYLSLLEKSLELTSK